MARTRKEHAKWLMLGLVMLLLIVGIVWVLSSSPQSSSNDTVKTPAKVKKQKTAVKLPIINLQPTVDGWAARQSGVASVVVIDLANKKTVAKLQADREYFTASLYKLYVAYEGYKKIEDGTYKLNDIYLSGYNRGQCLDAMLRSSYSPCGEKMWNELGKENLTNQLKDYGLTHTSMTGLTTTAHDTAAILQRLFERKDLNKEYTNLYLGSLKDQPELYRRGLPSGFKKSIVYNKVGWNGTVEWHDTAIVTLPNKRSYIMAVLTQNVGAKNIAELGTLIENKLSK